MDVPNVPQKVLQFEAFIDNVLKADLAKLAEKLDEIETDIAEFMQLKSVITVFQNANNQDGLKTQVDIGNSFFIQAHIPDLSNILLDVGLGHYVEFTLEEALVIINIRIKLLEQRISHLRDAISRTQAYIKVMLMSISKLENLKENV